MLQVIHHPEPVSVVGFCRESAHLISASIDRAGTVKITKIGAGEPEPVVASLGSGGIYSLVLWSAPWPVKPLRHFCIKTLAHITPLTGSIALLPQHLQEEVRQEHAMCQAV
eukprot:TRINITY_DN3598_c0_g1_i2.p3 TRINITY_DN3598_c0_g1~~TRINITY_DN3598_c0_g1_i2.p3  ORF type:complete len:111 (-),score=25.63 TRINITY_DN3598_c0_g1_i2:4-336(-)